MRIIDLSQESVDSAIAHINATSPEAKAVGVVCDVCDESAVKRCFETICGAGRLDILVNNAGIGAVGTVQQATGADMDRMYAVNVKGVFHCLKAGVNMMLADGKGGAIVNVRRVTHPAPHPPKRCP